MVDVNEVLSRNDLYQIGVLFPENEFVSCLSPERQIFLVVFEVLLDYVVGSDYAWRRVRGDVESRGVKIRVDRVYSQENAHVYPSNPNLDGVCAYPPPEHPKIVVQANAFEGVEKDFDVSSPDARKKPSLPIAPGCGMDPA
jgi:hypothetical protein